MTVILPGFPTEVSEKIEMPDIAELLSMPMFRVAEADTVRKYGTDFQKKLLDMCPLGHQTKRVLVYSSVHLMRPNIRAISLGVPDDAQTQEWHIDGLEGTQFQHLYPEERVHLLMGHTSQPTIFNTTPIEVSGEPLTYVHGRFNQYLRENHEKIGLIGKEIELGRIYTFTNHIHRAPNSDRVEFRYIWRVRETNRPDTGTLEQQMPERNKFFNTQTREWDFNLTKNGTDVTLHFSK